MKSITDKKGQVWKPGDIVMFKNELYGSPVFGRMVETDPNNLSRNIITIVVIGDNPNQLWYNRNIDFCYHLTEEETMIYLLEN